MCLIEVVAKCKHLLIWKFMFNEYDVRSLRRVYSHFLKRMRVHLLFLPIGVSDPSFSLRTISVCPSMRNLGGLFLAEQYVNKYPNMKYNSILNRLLLNDRNSQEDDPVCLSVILIERCL